MTATSTTAATIESNVQAKRRTQENFPVGSFLIPRELRADVHAYYRYARIADDVADNPSLSTQQKCEILDHMEAAVRDSESNSDLLDTGQAEAATTIGDRLRARSLNLELATDLLVAFRLDAENNQCKTWAELMDYCRFSACPVGRFLLGLHGETAGFAESDALCSALQILNHIQDAQEDFETLNRVYIPEDWLVHDASTKEDLTRPQVTQNLRTSLNRMLDQTNALINLASPLPKRILNRRLAAEAGVCLGLAKSLSRRLKAEDPLTHKVRLSSFDWFASGLHGLMWLVRP